MRAGSDADWFDRAPCALVALSFAGDVVEANDVLTRWTGHAREELRGRAFSALLDPGSRVVFETSTRSAVLLDGSLDEVALTVRKADGSDLPVLLSAVRDDDAAVLRLAIFNAAGRVRYERDLLAARRTAEASEQRVRVLQEVSMALGVSATDEDVAHSFAAVACDAFSARETAVLLTDSEGRLVLTGGTNPLHGEVARVSQLLSIDDVTVVHTDDPRYGDLGRAMRDAGLDALSATSLSADGERLGMLVSFFATPAEFDEHFIELQRAFGRQASQTLLRVRLQRRLAQLALHDQLTGVANRQLLQQTLDDAIAAAQTSGDPLSVLFLDVDEFKSINDAFGHAAGDAVLVELATRLREGVRTRDVVGRIGGDEFVAICPGADVRAAEAIAERILTVCRQPMAVSGGIISASVSVGISLYRPDGDSYPTAQQLLVRADAAMYDAKRAGKDRAAIDA